MDSVKPAGIPVGPPAPLKGGGGNLDIAKNWLLGSEDRLFSESDLKFELELEKKNP